MGKSFTRGAHSVYGFMTRAAEHILREALNLDESDRATLAGLLLGSLDDDIDDDAAQAWVEEVDRRAKQLDSGEVTAIPWEDVRARLMKKSRGTPTVRFM